jgi:hypothetical protein
LGIVDVIDFTAQYLPMYRAGFIYNLTMPKPVKEEQFDRIINGDAVGHFAKLARVETGGSVYGLVALLAFKHIISNSPSICVSFNTLGKRTDRLVKDHAI